MHLYKTKNDIIIKHEDKIYFHPAKNWDEMINRVGLRQFLLEEVSKLDPIKAFGGLFSVLEGWSPITKSATGPLQAPLGQQEIWAAGVTYYRSRVARMEESESAGGADFYDKVYDAERPEIFYKGNALRTSNPYEEIYIRKDSDWNVPEPELTLFISSVGTIEGYTIGNDVSSRSIEGENPLYLPQAKVYDRSAALGPGIYLPEEGQLSPNTTINLEIRRGREIAFNKGIAISQMKRKHQELVDYLYRETSFPHGCFLMTGTGIVPDNDFTLQAGDEVTIKIEGIGMLKNTVAYSAA